MLLVFGVIDRILDIIGLATVIWFTVKLTRWVTARWYRWRHPAGGTG